MRTPFFAAAAVAVVALLLGGCGGGDQRGSPTPGPGSTPTSAPTPATSASDTPAPAATTETSDGQTRALPIYYVVDTRVGLRLYREFHSVPRTDDPATDAARELFAHPIGNDPDYRSYWPAATRLRDPVQHGDGVITVDLNAAATQANVGSEAADRTVAQLIYTVQGALQSTDPVRILIDGTRIEQLWGHVAAGEPIGRGDPYQIRSLVQIDRPAHGASVGRTFDVSGEAAAFEANVPWQILRDGQVVRSGFATALEGGRFSAFRFSVTLEPGEYTLRVVEDDPSGGEGRPPFEDTKLIRVGG